MKIATVLFTYNRSKHTKAVLDALEHSEIMPESLYIFQDGMKENDDREEWETVNKIIKNVSFCKTKTYIDFYNKGLADSIVNGLNLVFAENDAVIVLEDDCVPHPQFITYMETCLNKYNHEKSVYTIGGCAWDIELDRVKEDAYFNQRFSSWGWATWKDRWDQYERDYMLLKRMLKNPQIKERVAVWGADLSNYLVGNIMGINDSWAVFWALKIIEQNGYCLSPYESLIKNIGFDGSGTHCGTLKMALKYQENENLKEYILPDKIVSTKECEEAFQDMLSWTPTVDRFRAFQDLMLSMLTDLKGSDYCKRICSKIRHQNIAIWGTGKICDFLIEELKDSFHIECIVLSKPDCSVYRGIQVVSAADLPDDVKEIIVIPFYDLEKIRRKMKRSEKNAELTGFDSLLKSSM